MKNLWHKFWHFVTHTCWWAHDWGPLNGDSVWSQARCKRCGALTPTSTYY